MGNTAKLALAIIDLGDGSQGVRFLPSLEEARAYIDWHNDKYQDSEPPISDDNAYEFTFSIIDNKIIPERGFTILEDLIKEYS